MPTENIHINVSDLLNVASISFTEREVDVVSCIVRGKSAKAMARLLSISPHTINTHIKNIMRKIDCNSQEQIVFFIESHGKHMLFHEHYSAKFNNAPFEKTENIFAARKILSIKKYLYPLTGLLIISLCLIVFLFNDNAHVFTNSQVLNKDVLLHRMNLIKKIDNVFAKQSNESIKFAILSGCGGSGKTTISRTYLQSQRSNIRWEVNAETKDSLLNSFADLANIFANTKELKEDLLYIKAITNQEEKQKSLELFVMSGLKKSSNWCLFFDNVDDFNAVKSFMPFDQKVCGDGKVLITTRNENLKNIGYLKQASAISIGELSGEEQLELFCNILYGHKANVSKPKLEEVKIFLKHIPKFPLDISTAAYYLKNMQISFEDYLNMTNKVSRDFEKYQRQLLSENISYSSTRYGIITSTFNNILKRNPDFKELLLFICLVDSQNIPKNYLKKCKDSAIVDDFVYNLRKHSLITGEGDTFSIHRSTQEVGLNYILNILPEAEKIKYLDEIVKVMTPYNEMCWLLYRPLHPMNEKERWVLYLHANSIVNKFNQINFSVKKKEEYDTKLLLALAHSLAEGKSQYAFDELLKNVLKLNANNKYIKDRDVAVALSELAYYYLYSTKFNESEKYIRKALELCSHLNGATNLYILNLAYLGGLYSKRNNFEEAKKYIEQAWNLALKAKEADTLLPIVWYQLHYNYIDNYVNKKEVYTSINCGLGLLKNRGAYKLFYKRDNNHMKSIPFFTAGIRERLATAYNRLGEYEKALECEYEAYYVFLKNSYEEGTTMIRGKSHIDAEYGYTLLRTGKIENAEKILTRSIELKQKFHDNYRLLNAIISRAESRIRLGKLNEAYEDCKNALAEKRVPVNNYSKLLICTVHYHSAIIKHKQKDTALCLEYFEDFFNNMDKFCKDFLNKDIYDKLVKENAFEFIKDKSNIKKCLQNSLKIFTSIYGENHSFVKDYVADNCKQHSYIFEKARVIGHYLRYYLDLLRWLCRMK